MATEHITPEMLVVYFYLKGSVSRTLYNLNNQMVSNPRDEMFRMMQVSMSNWRQMSRATAQVS